MGLRVLHSAIINLQQLTNLVLRSNSLNEVPTEIGELKKLKLIDFSFNRIEYLPPSIGKLPNLASLILAHNEVPHTIFIFPPERGSYYHDQQLF